MKATIRYMHTIEGQPAWYDGEQICYASWRRVIPLVRDLATIKRQRRAANDWRTMQGFEPNENYGHFRVEYTGS